MAEGPDRQQLLTALTTEHFGLAGARAQTTGESSSRAALYISSVSSTLVALGFIGQISQVGDVFNVFALTALPTLYVLGLFTFTRLVQSTVEDIFYGRAINRIRSYYLELAGPEGRAYFMLSGHDDAPGVLSNMALRPSPWQSFFTMASMVAVINSVVGGSAIAIAIGAITAAPLGVAAGVGGAVAILSFIGLRRYETRLLEAGAAEHGEVLFPSPPPGGE
jgi:hypothetical protein